MRPLGRGPRGSAWCHGQILVEALVGLSLALVLGGIVVIGIGGSLVADRVGAERLRASALATEGIEAKRAVRDTGWEKLVDGPHGIIRITNPATSAPSYDFSGQVDVSSDGLFRRTVTVEPVYRTSAGDITPDPASGTLDPDSKFVRAVITWDRGNRLGDVTLQSLLTNWRERTWRDTLQSDFASATLLGTQAIAAPPPPAGNGSLRLQAFGSGQEFGGEPTIEGTYSLDANGPTDGRDVALAGGYAYVVTGSNAGGSGFHVLDVSLPGSPTLAGRVDPGGKLAAVAVHGAYAYIATDRNQGELQVIDIRDPSAPIAGASVNLVGNEDGTSIAADGPLLFFGRARSSSTSPGLTAFSLANPASPVLLGSRNIWPNTPDILGIATRGRLLYVATSAPDAELVIVDTGVPEPLFVVGHVDLPGTSAATSVTVSGNTAYVTRGGVGALDVLTLAEPQSPVLAGSIGTNGPANDVTVLGSYAYVATGAGAAEFLRIDISNPSVPAYAGSVDLASDAWGVAAQGPFAYLATQGNTQEFVAIGNDPASPVALSQKAFLDLPGSADARALVVQGTVAFLGTEENPAGPEFVALDIRNPFAPLQIGSAEIGGSVFGISLSGSYALLSTSVDGAELQAFDVSDGANPRFLRSADLQGTGDGRGSAVYGVGGILVRDAVLNDPWLAFIRASSTGVVTGTLTNTDTHFQGGRGVSLSGSSAYVPIGTDDGSLELYRVAAGDENAPQVTGAYDAPGSGGGMAAFAAAQKITLLTNDRAGSAPEFFMVTAPSSMAPLALESPTSALDLGGNGNALQVFGPVAYVATDAPTRQFQVIDLQTRTSPARRISRDLGAAAHGVAVADDFIYLGTGKDDAEFIILEGRDTGFGTNGTAESVPFDSGFDATAFVRLAWTALTSGGVVQFQIRTGMTQSTLLAAPFLGPDGTANTFFTSSPSLLLTPSGQPLAARWMQWKVLLSGDGAASPELQEVLVSFRP